jgi:hypothetical protein
MERFGNNALCVIRVAMADGILDHIAERVRHLPSVTLTGKASVVDRTALDRVRSRLGPELLSQLVEKILGDASVSIVGGPPPESLVAALLACFPPQCRCEFSFSTGLKFSRRRPFRIIFAPEDPKELKQFVRQSGCIPFDLARPPEALPPLEHGWALFLHEVLSKEQPGILSAQFGYPRPGLTLSGLDHLGRDLFADPTVWQTFAAHEHHDDEPGVIPFVSPTASLSTTPLPTDTVPVEPVAATLTRAHAAHPRFESSRRAAVASTIDTLPARSAVAEAVALDPTLQERLEHLDDVVFEAIDGKPEALDELKTLWPELTSQLAAAAIDESREQYLRRALDVWNQNNSAGETRNATRATAALDVLCLLVSG